MKRALLASILCLHAGLAIAADDVLIRFDDPSLALAAALGKQVNVSFAGGAVAAKLPKPEYEGLVVSELPDGKVCLFGRPQGIEPDAPDLAGIGRPDLGDFCIARSDASVRVKRQEVDGAPAVPFYNTDKANCAWSWKTGRGIGLWTEDCRFETGVWDVAYDEANDWFALRVNGGDPFPVVRQFRMPSGATPPALLPELKAQGLILDDAECVFALTREQSAPAGWTMWEVVPTGKRKEAFDASPKDEVPEAPCGELGLAVDFTGYFMVHKSHADRLLYVNLGQDGTMIDVASITLN